MSATPPADVPENEVFPGTERDTALDHARLRLRMQAAKPAKLVVVKRKKSTVIDPLPVKAAESAQSYATENQKHRIAVIVNRVRTAVTVARTLREQLGESAEVVLLTGRLRPFERDRLVEMWKPYLRANDPGLVQKAIVLVATQCIEVGADFSFDALVTEAASLDALRQRFGRLNRMGSEGDAPAVILIREDDAKEDATDPIYGSSIVACWRLLKERGTAGTGNYSPMVIDFGIDALDALLADIEDLSPYLAPTPNAPTLLPAHLDLLCQTSPVPRPDPDVQAFLHGIGRGEPEARVVWRADLTADSTKTWKETIALCPPASTETLSVPLFRLRQWLADFNVEEDAGDVEGAVSHKDDRDGRIRPVLVWAGREQSTRGGRSRSGVVRKANAIRPNDLVVVPADYGMVPLGQSEPGEAFGSSQLDLWEVARSSVGRPPAMRLHRRVLEPWLHCPPMNGLVTLAADPVLEQYALQEAIDAVLTYEAVTEEDPPAPPRWLIEFLRQVRHGRIEAHPAGGLVLFSRQHGREDVEPDLFADDDDLLGGVGREVSLDDHTESVKRAVEKMAARCLGEPFLDAFTTAAEWHDVGKFDERFQVLLCQGDELAALSGNALAKSAEIPSSPARRRAIRDASGLPSHFRHEMLSLQLAESYAPLPQPSDGRDLVLHLVASHHGHARPFAPVSLDPEPPGVSGCHAGVTFELDAGDRAALPLSHSLNSRVSERFWRLTRKHGWWGVAYLEAILRLADWYGSQHVVSSPIARSPLLSRARCKPAAKSAGDGNPCTLLGLESANPLGFLAAIGTLVSLHAAGHRDVRLSWSRAATWRPVLSGVPTAEPAVLAELVAECLSGDTVSENAESRRKDAQKRYDAARKAVKDKQEEIKKRRLRGKERSKAIEAEVVPLEAYADRCRDERQIALRQAVPRPELAIGKHIDCTIEEFREHAAGFLDFRSSSGREALDFLAAFASDACLHESKSKRTKGILEPTPFCFITGSGHQYFLDTVRQLMTEVTTERVRSTLFEPWRYSDEKLSMRWDPVEDRRYALMDRDPTASDNKSRTEWMANLLAYRALSLFATVPRRGKLATTSWMQNGSESAFTWPIWSSPIDVDTVRSLMLLPDLTEPEPDHTALRARGVQAVFRARRIKVGSETNFKVNFSSAKAV